MDTIAVTVEQLLKRLPAHPGSFEQSQFPLPVTTAVEGNGKLDMAEFSVRLKAKAAGDVKHLLEPLLVAAELIESVQLDRAEYFLTDANVRDRVFMGSKWMAGWVLVLGNKHGPALLDRLREKSFMVFTDQPGIENTNFIGSRDTSPVYFLQLMARFGMVWGGIAPGDPHELGHYLERDMPGFIVISEDLPSLKYLVALGLMKLGAPAVVPSTFPFPYGNRVVADTLEEILARGQQFENLRVRFFKDEVIHLPEYANPALAQEKFDVAKRVGGTADSFICVKPGTVDTPGCKVLGVPHTSVGMLIEVDAEGFTDDIAQTVETTAVKALSFMQGVRGYDKKGSLVIESTKGVDVDFAKLAQTVHSWVRLHFPRLERVRVRVFGDPAEVHAQAADVRAYKRTRNEFVEAMTEENTGEFVVCTECRPFSLVHTCIVTPDRTPMCSSRTYATIKAAALFGSPAVPFQRRTEEHVELRRVFPRGAMIDRERGEYEGANRMYREMTHGTLDRVFLHSVRGYPHTSCGCFQALAFWIDEVEGIGVMGRGSKAIAPNGMTWDSLANAAGGKQTDGVMGISVAYVRSRHFLKGDGGHANLVWMDSELLGKVKDVLPKGRTVATERDAGTVEALRGFLRR